MNPPDEAPEKLESKAEARLKRFVEEYVIDRNGTRAYMEAYGRQTADGRDRSKHAASVEACRLLKRQEVINEVRAAEAHLRQRCYYSADRIYHEIGAIAFSDIGNVIDFGTDGLPRPKAAREIPFKARRAIQSMKVQTRKEPGGDAEVVTVEYKFYSKLAALEKLTLLFGLDAKKHQLECFLEAMPDDLRPKVLEAIQRSLNEQGQRNPHEAPDPEIIIEGDGPDERWDSTEELNWMGDSV